MRPLRDVSAVQLGLAVGSSGWALGGGEYDPEGISEYVVSDDGTGAQRRWRVRVPLELDEDGWLLAGPPIIEEIG
jgi:hypothetical protein